MPDEARAVPLPWACRVTFTLDGSPPYDREVRGPTSADAAALARSLAERGAREGVWVTAYRLMPPGRIFAVDLSDPVHSK